MRSLLLSHSSVMTLTKVGGDDVAVIVGFDDLTGEDLGHLKRRIG